MISRMFQGLNVIAFLAVMLSYVAIINHWEDVNLYLRIGIVAYCILIISTGIFMLQLIVKRAE
ncbi:hypothetical protein HF324_33300 [Chitinophaga oryzae]|uniref:Uncharacterized protein n=1 Tax=Chitinophaga oryzae TaxID=2725414 RepID=A0AAE6ZLE5_9BACT|nr:hypothetical protein [Chitinophaga oryzae]QJB35406.1 hypothetical protein HF329_30515 [Chitinophaga oryzae]QOD67401.1 hypothetical protein HF324_33300 [Chitinophaga oryzae]